MEYLKDNPEIILYAVLAIGTIYNLYLTRRQTNLIFMPAVGIIEINPISLLIDRQQGMDYKNVASVIINFMIKNVGNLPARNFKIDTIGKIDNTTLSHKETKRSSGSTVFPQQILINKAIINKDLIKDVVENKKRLRYKVEISYSDWKNYQKYNYSSYYEFVVDNKSPLVFSFQNSSEYDFSTEL
jgi:hypothetical protein